MCFKCMGSILRSSPFSEFQAFGLKLSRGPQGRRLSCSVVFEGLGHSALWLGFREMAWKVRLRSFQNRAPQTLMASRGSLMCLQKQFLPWAGDCRGSATPELQNQTPLA